MECDMCKRNDGAQIGMHCTVCARTAIYPIRLDIAKVLLEKESLSRKVEQSASSSIPNNTSDEVRALARGWRSEMRRTDLHALRQKVEAQDTTRASSKSEILQLRDFIEHKRDSLVQRGKDLDITERSIPPRRQTLTDKLSQIGKRGTKSFDSIHNSSADTRAFLCREAARLLGLSQKKVRDKTGNIHERFLVAGHIIPNLRFIHNTSCTALTSVLAALSHLVVLISFYLGVRPPAEITLPHRDYPLATISHPDNSYLSVKTPFPGSGSNVSLSSSPASSKYEGKAVSKPRPLFIGSDKGEALSLAAKHDPAAYRYFLEGLSLLAWDIVWLGHSQGFVFGSGSWEDACDVGLNLWQLIFSTQQSAAVPRTVSSRDVLQQQRKEGDRTTSGTASPRVSIGKLGDHSHASAHTFLGLAPGKEHQRAISLSSYTMIFDSLRKALDVEIKNAEWILLSEQEFDDGEERFDLNNNAVLLQKPDMLGRHYDQTRSILTTAMLEDRPNESPVNEPRNKGKSGWTMVKDRGNRA